MTSRTISQFLGNEYKLPKNIVLTSVRQADGTPVKWKQVGNKLVLKDDCPSDLVVQFNKTMPVPEAAYYPIPATPKREEPRA